MGARIDLVLVTSRRARLLEDSAVVASSASEPGWAIVVTHDGIPTRSISMTAGGRTALVRWTGPRDTCVAWV